MADILIAIAQLEEPARGGKQATLIVMTMNDIERIIQKEVEKQLQK